MGARGVRAVAGRDDDVDVGAVSISEPRVRASGTRRDAGGSDVRGVAVRRARGVADDRTEGTVAVRRDDGGEIFALGAGGVRIGDERVRGTSALESLVGV